MVAIKQLRQLAAAAVVRVVLQQMQMAQLELPFLDIASVVVAQVGNQEQILHPLPMEAGLHVVEARSLVPMTPVMEVQTQVAVVVVVVTEVAALHLLNMFPFADKVQSLQPAPLMLVAHILLDSQPQMQHQPGLREAINGKFN